MKKYDMLIGIILAWSWFFLMFLYYCHKEEVLKTLMIGR